MSNGEWATQRERRESKQAAVDAARFLKIEWQDKFWLATHHPIDESVLVWLSENRSVGSRIGSSRWNLETLPQLVETQAQLRKAERFEEILSRAAISHQTITTDQILREGGFSTIPQADPVENSKPQNPALQRPRRSDAGLARKPQRTTHPTS